MKNAKANSRQTARMVDRIVDYACNVDELDFRSDLTEILNVPYVAPVYAAELFALMRQKFCHFWARLDEKTRQRFVAKISSRSIG